ncbi:hypothetical protein GPALN_009725 [Globodera pallida]|nr:hypothetical protein GPALN_009725 [Globodera pallida]
MGESEVANCLCPQQGAVCVKKSPNQVVVHILCGANTTVQQGGGAPEQSLQPSNATAAAASVTSAAAVHQEQQKKTQKVAKRQANHFKKTAAPYCARCKGAGSGKNFRGQESWVVSTQNDALEMTVVHEVEAAINGTLSALTAGHSAPSLKKIVMDRLGNPQFSNIAISFSDHTTETQREKVNIIFLSYLISSSFLVFSFLSGLG